jgi:hypothetical protein
MSDSVPPLSSEVRRLIELEQSAPPAPAELRARALSRAAAFRDAGVAPLRPHFRGRWLLLAASLGVVVALGAFAAYRSGDDDASVADVSRTAPAVVSTVAPAPPAPKGTEPSEPPRSSPPKSASSAAPPSAVPRPSPEETYAQELALLQRARASLAKGEGAMALSAIAEHQRRFPGGRLREEREALRVKALMSLGRGDEARRAAERFKTEFPRSVLSPSIEQTAKPAR